MLCTQPHSPGSDKDYPEAYEDFEETPGSHPSMIYLESVCVGVDE
jgi:hypothetical protein